MSLIPAIILIIVAAIAGYAFGIVDSRVTKAVKDKINETPAEASKKPEDHIVLAVRVDQALKWHLELDDVPIEPAAITAEQRARLVYTVVQIRPWIDAKSASTPTPEPANAVRATPQPVALLPPTPSLATSLAPTQPPQGASANPPRINVLQGFRSLMQNDIAKAAAATPQLSIVQMIDEVLQKKLETSPLASRKIRLEAGAIGEVVVFIDKDRYPSIDAVPDEEVKAIIRAAIVEWEKK